MRDIAAALRDHPLLLTEGAVGQRIEREYGFTTDRDIAYAALLYRGDAQSALREIYRQYLNIAREAGLPILLLTNTRRANRERVRRSAYRDKNPMRDYAVFLRGIAADFRCDAFVGGMMGCRGDAYSGAGALSSAEAARFHAWQAERFRDAPVDCLLAGIMPAVPEAVGMARAMERTGKPYILSFMVSRKGTLPDGASIHDAIAAIDGSVSRPPLCYMSNCVHPAIVQEALGKPFNRTERVRERFRGVQANAACLGPEELDGSAELLTSDPLEWARAMGELHEAFPMKIVGGCCGTDQRHLREMVRLLAI